MSAHVSQTPKGLDPQVVETIRNFPVFAGFPNEFVEQLSLISEYMEVPEGSEIIKQSSDNQYLYFLTLLYIPLESAPVVSPDFFKIYLHYFEVSCIYACCPTIIAIFSIILKYLLF